MRNQLFLMRFLLFGIILGFIGCSQDEVKSDVVRYSGEVVYLNSTTPFPDLEVKVTNGHHIHCQSYTNEQGKFSLNVKTSEIDGTYYLLVGDSSCVTKRITLRGVGKSEVDVGIIEIEGPTTPVVITQKVSKITQTSAIAGGEVKSDGRLRVTERGVCYSTEPSPSMDDSHTINGSGLGMFSSELVGLSPNSLYFVRAYAKNEKGISYGDQISFTTSDISLSVETGNISEITASSVKVVMNVTEVEGAEVQTCGVCWSVMENPTIEDNHATADGVQVGVQHIFELTDLQPSTTYHVRAYAIANDLVVYGIQKSFTTSNISISVETGDVTDVNESSATVAISITDVEGTTVQSCGICWSVMENPTIEDNHVAADRVQIGVQYTLELANLQPSTTYYVRAYAVANEITVYGELRSFQTKEIVPVVKTDSIYTDDITLNSIMAHGVVVEDYNVNIIERGFCYSVTPGPTISSSFVVAEGTGKGAFACTISNIYPTQNTYYIRAYAKNIYGSIAYGEQFVITPEIGKYATAITMEYDGYLYKIYTNIQGEMTWQEASAACVNLRVGGYSDWYLPTKNEVLAILANNGTPTMTFFYGNRSDYLLYGKEGVWASSYIENATEHYAYYLELVGDGNGNECYVWNPLWGPDDNLFGVIAVRKHSTL